MLLDSNIHRDSLSFEDAKNATIKGNLIEFLKNKYAGETNLSLITGDDEILFNEGMSNVAEGLDNRERKETGIENNGLCLLIAYAVEFFQNTKAYLE